MAWAQKPLTAKGVEPDPLLIGLDLNATRARAVYGTTQVTPRPLPLDGAQPDLPMVLSLEGRRLQVGRAGASLCRLSPHLACVDFLAALGQEQEWSAGRHRLDAARALTVVLEQLQPACTSAKGMVLAVPAYLSRAQAVLLPQLAEKARLPLLGSVSTTLACALEACVLQPWAGTALVLDVDDHALIASTVIADGQQVWIHATQYWPHLSLRAWKGRLLDCVADRCIRQSRRDPRDSPAAEQSLYDQLEEALNLSGQGRIVELLIQTANWYQNLLVRPEEMLAFCDRLVRQTLREIQGMLTASAARTQLHGLFLTQAAGRLPGLASALESLLLADVPTAQIEPLAVPQAQIEPDSDFGEDLLQGGDLPGRVTLLAADVVARMAHAVAARMYRGELPHGHLDLAVPLSRSEIPPPVTNPPRRSFRLFSVDPGT
jgi:hypothetical protein